MNSNHYTSQQSENILDLNSNINLNKLSPREQKILKKQKELMHDSKFAAQIASYDNFVKHRINNSTGDSTIESKTRSLFQLQQQSVQFKPQESLFSVQNETSCKDFIVSSRTKQTSTVKNKNLVFSQHQKGQNSSQRDGHKQGEFGGLVIHNMSQKNDMTKLGVLDHAN